MRKMESFCQLCVDELCLHTFSEPVRVFSVSFVWMWVVVFFCVCVCELDVGFLCACERAVCEYNL